VSDYVDRLRDLLADYTVELATSRGDELDLIQEADVYVGVDLDSELLEAAESLKLFACISAGTGHLDTEALRDHGVAVTNASGVHGPNIAEHVIGWMLMITRRLDEGIRRQNRQEWRHFQAMGELKGSRVAVVGLGAIGQAVVRRLQGFGVETVGVRYTPEKGGPTDEVYGFGDVEEAIEGADYLLLTCPLTDETEELVGERELAALKPDSVLINVSRGPVVDTEALVASLHRNKLHAAALDVTDPEPLPADHPLWTFENVFITPHNAGHTPKYWERVSNILIENLNRVEERGVYKGLRNQVV
jgi:phosphoglycerate dehydrogenase-like enzyme